MFSWCFVGLKMTKKNKNNKNKEISRRDFTWIRNKYGIKKTSQKDVNYAQVK